MCGRYGLPDDHQLMLDAFDIKTDLRQDIDWEVSRLCSSVGLYLLARPPGWSSCQRAAPIRRINCRGVIGVRLLVFLIRRFPQS